MMQVKVNGFRIELGEIEAVLASHARVDQAVTLVKSNALIAYVTPKKGIHISKADVKDIFDYVSRYLTHYMVPRAVRVLESFSTTPNWKIGISQFSLLSIAL